jgi:hypothetical protein
MSSYRSSVSSRLAAALRALVVAVALVETGTAVAADVLPAPPEARLASSEAAPVHDVAAPGYGQPCDDRIARCDDVHIFAATRSLRQAGIQPAIAVVLAPATILVDTVFSPFAFILDQLGD